MRNLEKNYLYYSILTLTKSKYFVPYTIKFTANNDEVALLTRDALSGEQEIVTKEFSERF